MSQWCALEAKEVNGISGCFDRVIASRQIEVVPLLLPVIGLHWAYCAQFGVL